MMWCPNIVSAFVFLEWSMFEFIGAISTANLKAKGNMGSTNTMASRHLSSKMFLKFWEDFEWPQFPKLRLLRHQNFLRERSVGLCLWLSLGPRLLRQNTFAFGSREGCRGDCAVSPRGRRGCGCAGHFGPWPRRRIWGETSWGMGSLWGSEWRCW